MFELGDESAAEHQALGQLLTELALPNVVLVGAEMQAAAQGNFHYFPTRAAAAEWLRQHAPQGQQVLVKGSRGMALETLVELL
jgi:UDP-N-acetylmuramoyl-tripeptide--D-alanyl-D-alanine ligase